VLAILLATTGSADGPIYHGIDTEVRPLKPEL